MKRSEFWNRLFNSGGNGIFVFIGTALIAGIAIVITACPGVADAILGEPKYTVSYHVNGGEGTPNPETETVNSGETIATAPTDISRPGYTLNAAWNTKADGTGEPFKFGNGGTPITADITLYAQWTKQHTVSYDVNEGEGTPDPTTETVSDGETIAAAPTGISRPGHTLNTAWNTQADGTGESFLFGDEGTAVTEDITLYAQWSNQQHTVSYHANGGDGTPNPATQELNHNDIIATAPTVSKNGYTLNAQWNTQADGKGESFSFGSGGTPVTANMDLYAQWTKQHTVSYDVNEGEGTPDPITQTVSDGETIAAAPTGISRPGYTLNTAWNTKADGTGNSFLFGYGGTAVTEDITLYAQWSNQQHTVSYHANGGDGTPNPATQEINHNDIIATAPTVSRNGYTLNAQWNTQADGKGESFSFGSGGTPVTANMDLYAQWTINQYTVSYNFNRGDGTVPATETVNYKGTAPKPSDPTRSGHAFTGWFDAASGGSVYNFGTEVTADIDLYAQWTINQYTVSYNFNRGDGTVPATETVNYKGTAPKPSDPTRTGYTFAGWFDAASGGSVYNFGTEVTADIDLYAQWTIKQYSVSYNLNGASGTAPATEAVDHGGTFTKPADPTRSGYVFTGWFDTDTGGNEYNFGTAVTSDITLYAQWTIITYTVSYNFNRGDSTEPSTETVEHGGTATGPTTEPTRIGYTFDGWYTAETGGDAFDFETAVIAAIKLYAQWTPTLTVSGLNPADGSAIMDTTPTFSWDAVAGAAGYELQLSDSRGGVETAQIQSVTDTSYTPSSILTNEQTHYWRVRAVDGVGQKGDWSAGYSLDVQVPFPDFVHVAGGTFYMGSTDSDAYSDESPEHSVMVNSFYMAETELTFDQYDAYCTAEGISKPDDEGWGRGSRPVINVSWYDAVKYSNWLSEQEGLSKVYSISGTSVTLNQSANGYRLPTEAEWEYAARGGSQSKGYKYAGSNDVNEVGWHWFNSGKKTHPVKDKKANELGLYDMSGNVWEWCWDWYDSDYYSSSPGVNPTGPSSGSRRILRGGNWYQDSKYLRIADRSYNSPGNSNNNYGFRVVRTAD